MFAISWCCKKLRQYLLGTDFVVKTDHKPLVGLFKHIERIENQRLLAMVLSPSEFKFDLEFIPGTRNVIADFGSRMIPASDYPDPKDASPDIFFSFDDFCNFNVESLTPTPSISMSNFMAEDFNEIEQFSLKTKNQDDKILVHLHGTWYILVPHSLRRAIFWHIHFPRHHGITFMTSAIKEAGFYWPRLQHTITNYLSQCACAKSKHTKSPPYKIKKHLFATKSMQIICLDIYKFGSTINLTAMDLFSKFLFCFEIPNEVQNSISQAYSEFTSLYGFPDFIMHDNQFNFLPGKYPSTPSNHPQANAVLERFHKELGNMYMSRIHECKPAAALQYFCTSMSKMLF